MPTRYKVALRDSFLAAIWQTKRNCQPNTSLGTIACVISRCRFDKNKHTHACTRLMVRSFPKPKAKPKQKLCSDLTSSLFDVHWACWRVLHSFDGMWCVACLMVGQKRPFLPFLLASIQQVRQQSRSSFDQPQTIVPTRKMMRTQGQKTWRC